MYKKILSQPWAYSLFAKLVGTDRGRRIYIERHIRPKVGDRILDIGCGPADILASLPDVDYHGFDLSADYIEAARRRFGNRGTFHVEAVNADLVKNYSGFDVVLAGGILHHLTDVEAVDLFRVAFAALKPTGRLITFDGCFVDGQSEIAKRFLRADRGQFVRDEPGYVKLARHVFQNVVAHVHHKLLRIPYTHIVLECRPQ